MPTGIVLHANPQAPNRVDDVVAQATRADELGVRQVWLSQNNDHDAIALAAVVGAAVPGLGVGTSVVPINPRHPLIVASLAQTAQAASHGNFSLGLGLGGHEPERQAFGTSWPNPITRLREHLTVLRSVFDSGAVDFSGDEISAHPVWPVQVAGGTPVPVYVAAMAPRALQVTGELADGTMPYLAGPRTIAEFIEPAIAKSAADAGRPKPRLIAQVPAIICTDVQAGKDFAAERLNFFETIPSYQKVIAREGVAGAANLAAVGTAESIRHQLQRHLDAGATDVVLSGLAWTDATAAEDLWALAASL
ncbi:MULTISPECIES: TIGR03564 family F420-dependent LLM class oxidoreductase [unclassified Mycobacterium]|uniref:TIGR03564 family F420-dependent LLM class oxidoreductase n=1 Tax=unclassified Mycobacterium TaxID=2642494 RepID=UPI0029C949A9|nr:MULTISPECIES: TIGR03564 family F420-dependent LLM class oxidoreductase [unclassified Mycobacterium]